jgi:plastocyanin
MKLWTLLIAIFVYGLACSGDGAPTVQVLDNAFEPSTITIAPGGRVTWAWNGQNPHNVVFDPGSGVNSSAIQTSGAFDITFSNSGTYNYQCTIHPGMTGTVVVR